MTDSQRSGRGGLAWAIVGGVILVAGIVTIIVVSTAPGNAPSPTTSNTATAGPTPTGTDQPGVLVVDESVVDRGWLPEPITTDPETYITSALEAAATFDTTLSTRDDWLTYLDSWFTPDTRYSAAEQAARMKAAQLELRQGVVLPQEEWDSLAAQDGRVEASTNGDVVFVDVSEDPTGDMSIGTADVTLTFTQSDGSGGEASFDDTVRVSVQVLCGPGSIPTPDSDQQAGDCKVVRFFTEPLEP